MIEIDGSTGEGGGQIVRTALALSVATGSPFQLTNIRANRSQPGLRPQHVTAVEAAATISQATVSDAQEGTRALTMEPSAVHPGRYHFDVETAGSAVLVLQTILPPLLTASGPSTVTVVGGTHIRWAPPFDFFATAFLPLVQRMGPVLDAQLGRVGFYPRGGGRCTLSVEPVQTLRPLDLIQRGRRRRHEARALIANLPRHIGERELTTLQEHLPTDLDESRIETVASASAGNALVLELSFEHVTEVISGIGQKGLPAEEVATRVAREARRYLKAEGPVGQYLGDQLLLPVALGGGRFWTTTLTPHAQTNAAIIERFLGNRFAVTKKGTGWLVEATPSS